MTEVINVYDMFSFYHFRHQSSLCVGQVIAIALSPNVLTVWVAI